MHCAQPHLEALYSAIRSKALIQYVTPFTSVNMATMATAFGTSVGCVDCKQLWQGLPMILI